MKIIRFILILMLLAGISKLCNAQSIGDTTTTSVNSNEGSFKTVFKGKPGKAALYSLIFPGLGQAYNKRIWKVPIVLAIEGGVFYYALYNHNEFRAFNSAYRAILDGEIDNFRGLTSASQIRLFRDRYRQRKDYGWVFFGIAHILNIIEAFVDRHLREFDVDEDLSINILNRPQLVGNQIQGLGIGISYNLNKELYKSQIRVHF